MNKRRFSDHPSIKTDPPYWAGEKFAEKATSLINASLLEPTIPNLQFWGIISCLEYGRASGSKYNTYKKKTKDVVNLLLLELGLMEV